MGEAWRDRAERYRKELAERQARDWETLRKAEEQLAEVKGPARDGGQARRREEMERRRRESIEEAQRQARETLEIRLKAQRLQEDADKAHQERMNQIYRDR